MIRLATAAFFRGYHLLPQRLINQATAQLMQVQTPRAAVQAAIRLWISAADIDMSDFADEPYDTLEAFFLRRLRPGARPLGPGLVSPVDGEVFAAGRIEANTELEVKGQRIRLERLVNGHRHSATLAPYIGGHYASVFLRPRGYHHIHAPLSSTLVRIQSLPGRYFPQNAQALSQIAGVYERNERVALFFRARPSGLPFVLVLIGASLVGGIHLHAGPHEHWRLPAATLTDQPYDKGDRLGHFSFGSTVVMLLPPGLVSDFSVQPGTHLQMGQALAPLADPDRTASEPR
jgi:phosphatidylserine decarboxylase